MAYWMDWTIVYRNAQEMKDLADGLDGARVGVDVDATGIQMFMTVDKPEIDDSTHGRSND